MKKLSIIIVTYNSQKDILNCLKSIFETSDIDRKFLECIIVDNSSIEVFSQTKNLVTENYGDEIMLFHNSKNGGYGQGNNIGIAMASADTVCIVNPDVLFLKPMFKEALNTFKTEKDLAMIGGKQFGGENISFWIRPEFDFFILTAPFSKILNKLDIYLQNFFYLSGALLFMDKKKIEEINCFDESFFMYCEETDITKRLLNKGYKTKYIKEFKYHHLIDERAPAGENSLKFLINSYKKYFTKYNYNFRSFIFRRYFSFKAIMVIAKCLRNKNLYNKNREYLMIFKKNINK